MTRLRLLSLDQTGSRTWARADDSVRTAETVVTQRLPDIDFSPTYKNDDKTNPAEWLAEHGWIVHGDITTLDLQASYGRPAPDVDATVDGLLGSQYIAASR